MHVQMIESSAHGDEYDGVIFSQLVWLTSLIIQVYILLSTYLAVLNSLFRICTLELN